MPEQQPREEAHTGCGQRKHKEGNNSEDEGCLGPAQSLPAAELEGAANTAGPRHSHT